MMQFRTTLTVRRRIENVLSLDRRHMLRDLTKPLTMCKQHSNNHNKLHFIASLGAPGTGVFEPVLFNCTMAIFDVAFCRMSAKKG